MILSKSLKHGWYYYYKLHKEKLSLLSESGFDDVQQFLLDVRRTENRPDNQFTSGPRGSQVDVEVDVDLDSKQHLVCDLAGIALDSDYYKDDHMNVQMFMLAYDKETIAMEVPVWMDTEPLRTIESDTMLTGHIDLLRVENDKLWIWDYKPDAHLEKDATSQTLSYALMIARRTGVDLDSIRCGYFDQHNAYTFSPATLHTDPLE